MRHYVHIGTGNYHAKTARLYEDFGLFTTDREIAADVTELFNTLTGSARSPTYRKVITAPEDMRPWFLDQVERDDRSHEAGEDARIVLKMNSLVDALHPGALRGLAGGRASRPERARHLLPARGRAGVSENIRVISVVGRFLEHSRLYGFRRGDERLWWMGSADLMPRNLDTRVELLAPIEDPALRAEIEDTVKRCLADDTFAWELRPDETWERRRGGTRSAHRELMERALERAAVDPPLRPARAPASRRAAPAPSRRLSASTRAAERRTRSRNAGELRARSSRRGKTSFPAGAAGHEDQVGSRSTDRSGRGRHARAVQHRLGLEAVRDRDALEAELVAQQLGRDARRLRGDPVCVELRDRGRARASRADVGADRGAERAQLGAAGGRGVVGVHVGAAQAREVLAVAARRADHMPAIAAFVLGGHRAANGAGLHHGTGRVRDRREVDVDPGGPQSEAAARAESRTSAGVPCSGWPLTGRPSRPCARRRPPGRPSPARRCGRCAAAPGSTAATPAATAR